MDQMPPGQEDVEKLQAAGATDDEVEHFKMDTIQKLRDGGANDDEIGSYYGVKKPNDAPLKDMVAKNQQVYHANKPEPFEASNPFEAFYAGLQESIGGKMVRLKHADAVLPQDASDSMQLAHGIGSLIGDVPALVAGGAIGSGATLPTGPGAVAGAMTGAFATQYALRKYYDDEIDKGAIIHVDPGEFAKRAVGVAFEGMKGALVGKFSELSQGAAAVFGKAASTAAELTAMVSTAAAVEGQLPTVNDFKNGAIMVGGMEAMHVAMPKMRNMWTKTGMKIADIADAAAEDIQLKQDLLSENPDLPKEAQPTELKHEVVNTAAEGEKPKLEVKQELVPKDITPKEPAISSLPNDINEKLKEPGVMADPDKLKEVIQNKEQANALEDQLMEQHMDASRAIKEAGGQSKASTRDIMRLKDASDGLASLDKIKGDLPEGLTEKDYPGGLSKEDFEKTKETLLHGTTSDFENFKEKGEGAFSDLKQKHYFTDSPDIAEEYSKQGNGESKIISADVYGKTLDLTSKDSWPKELVQKLRDSDDRHDKELLRDYESGNKSLDTGNFLHYEASPALEAFASENGYGKIKHPDIHEGKGLPQESTMVPDARYIKYGDNDPAERLGKEKSPPSNDVEKYFDSLIGKQDKQTRSLRDKALKTSDDFWDGYARTLDKSSAVRRMYEKAGIEPKLDDAAFLMQQNSAASDMTDHAIRFGTVDRETGEIGEPLNKIKDDYQKDFKDDPNMKGLARYGVAAHALELAAREKSIHVEVNGDKIDLSKAQELVDANKEKMQPYLDRLVKWENSGVKAMHDSGYWSEDQYNAIIDQNKQRVSFGRIQEPSELTGEIPKNSKGIKKIKGSGGLIANPIEAAIRNMDMKLRLADENDVKNKYVDDIPPEFVRETTPGSSKEAISTDIDKEISTDFTKDINGQTGAMSVWKDGEKRTFETHPIVAEAFNSMAGSRPLTNVFAKLLKGFATVLRQSTVNDPFFGFRHAWKNEQTASVLSQTGFRPFWDTAKYMGQFLSEDPAYQEALRNKAFMSSVMPATDDYINGVVFKNNDEAPWIKRAWNSNFNPFTISHALITTHDNMIRFSEYQKAVTEQGKTPAEAASLARNVIPDYQRSGIQKSALMQLAPFVRVHLSSEAQTLKAFNEDRVGTTLKTLAYMTAPRFALYALNQGDPRYEEQPVWQKMLFDSIITDNWKPATPRLFAAVQKYEGAEYAGKLARQNPDGSMEINDGHVFRLPIPFSLGVASLAPIVAMEAYRKHDPKVITDWAKELLSSFGANLMPTAAVPAVEQAFNYNLLTGRRLVSALAEKQLPELEQTPYTSETAKQAALALTKLTDNWIHPNPIIIDNYVRAWTGVQGTYVTQLFDKGLHEAGIGDTSSRPDKQWADTPFVKSFMFRHPTMQTQDVEDFYDKYERTQQAVNSFKTAAKNQDQDTMNYIKEYHGQDLVNMQGIAKSISAQINAINQTTKRKDWTSEEKTQEIEILTYGVMASAREGNKLADALIKKAKDKGH
jgi:hypothetical protein